MRIHPLTLALALSGSPGCGGEHDDTAGDPCRSSCDDNRGGTVLVHVSSDRLDSPVAIEINPCVSRGYLPDGAPVVVVLSGSFSATVTPVDRHELEVESMAGIVALYPSFPTDQGDFGPDSAGDYRGSAARWATEAALDYASGGLRDDEGCTLADRITPPLSYQAPWLHGQSNGGNLALAVLADEDLDLPAISGVTTFETPSAAQFATVEVGSITHPLPLYQPGQCSWSTEEGLVCALDYSWLSWDPEQVDEDGHQGVACFDLDKDGACGSSIDSLVWGLRPEVNGEEWIVYSPPMNQAMRGAALLPPGLLGNEETRDFWATRDASRMVERAVLLHPELPYLVLGTETDHTLGIEDHAHVSGLAHALQRVGAAWVRVNPDRVFLERLMGEPVEWLDNPANQPTTPGDPALAMLPDASALGVHSRTYVTAALAELMERSWCGAWQEDLDHVLLP